jgi:hypothetical protein
LLRGERAETYIGGGERREVCELCKSRALNEGWVREGTAPAYDPAGNGSERRRSLLSRLRSRVETRTPVGFTEEPPPPPEPIPAPLPERRSSRRREPRHVRAVPTSIGHKQASAIDLFNGSEHRRTIAGVARSLGPPEVAVLPSPDHSSVVTVTVSWELCWYRYEVDLSDDEPTVRVGGQGSELDELEPAEREPNAASDENGSLTLL